MKFGQVTEKIKKGGEQSLLVGGKNPVGIKISLVRKYICSFP
jgi:hypothetical protein